MEKHTTNLKITRSAWTFIKYGEPPIDPAAVTILLLIPVFLLIDILSIPFRILGSKK